MTTPTPRTLAIAALVSALALPLAGCDDDAPVTVSQSASSAGTSTSETPAAAPSQPVDGSATSSISPLPSEPEPTVAPSAPGEGAADVLKTSREATRGASSASVKSLIQIDNSLTHIRGTRDGTNQEILITGTTKGVSRTRRVGDTTFVNGNAQFWSEVPMSAARRKLVINRWVPIPTADTATTYTYTTLLNDFWTLVDQAHPTNDASTPVTRVTHAGRPALRISLSAELTVIVSADDQHLLLHVTTDKQIVDYSEWGTVKPYTAPPKGQLAPS